MGKQSGQGLWELLTALCISALITSTAVPALCKVRSKSFTEREAKNISHWFEMASLKAVYQRRDFTIKVTTQELGAWDERVPKRPIVRHLIPATIRVILGRPSVSLYRSGVTSPTTIRIVGPEARCSLALSLRGRVTMQCEPL